MIFLATLSLVALAAAIALWRLKTTGATLYWFTAWGYRSLSLKPGPRPRRVDPVQLRLVIQALLDGKGFDSLFVFPTADDDRNGPTLENGMQGLSVLVTFLALLENDLKLRTIDAMGENGWPLIDENAWNEGLGPDMESVTLKFAVSANLEDAYRAAETVLAIHGTGNPSERFVSAWNSASFPTGDRGLKIEMPSDPLAPILDGTDPI